MIGALLVSCATICASHLYPKGFDHPDKRACYCADIVKKSDPPAMEINARWAPEVPEDKRVFILEHPKKPNFDLEREAGELDE
jgi:hypothetical protein